jgi:hypothetical protein
MAGESSVICAGSGNPYGCYYSYFSGAAGFWGGALADAAGQLYSLNYYGYCSDPNYYSTCAYLESEVTELSAIVGYCQFMMGWASS